MRLVVVAALVLGLSPAVARAQATSPEAPLAGGVRAGVAGSSWIGSGDASTHLGLALGGFVSLRVTPAFALQPELIMLDKGADFTDASGEPADEGLLFLELPVLARYDLPLTELASLYGVAGPGLAYLVDSKRTPTEDLRRFDLTMTGGVGLDLYTPQHYISIDLRAGVGLLDLREDARTARAFHVGLLGGVTL